MFTYCYETRYGDYKDFETIKPGTVLDIVQDISIRDSNRCGYGLDVLRAMNKAWLMQGINVRFIKPVKTHLPIEVSTAVKSLRGVTSERGCILRQEGEVVAQTIAHWFLFDTEKMRVSKVSQEMIDAYEFFDFADPFFTYEKPPLYQLDTASGVVKVGNKDIDTNRHLNNQKGAEMLMDALPFDFAFDEVRLLYKKEAHLGDELEVCTKKLDNGFYVHLQTREKEICIAGVFVRN